MARSVRKVSFLACLLLVLLRVSIGWQFLYEGLWKLNTQKTAKPWSAEGYLLNAKGPLRDRFRGMVEDPNGFAKLDYDTLSASWNDWRDRFIAHHTAGVDASPKLTAEQKRDLKLSEKQQQDLNQLLDGPSQWVQGLEALPEGLDLARFKPMKFKAPEGYVRYNEKQKRLETNLHLIPEERDALLKLVEPVPQTDEEKAIAADPNAPRPELSDAAKKYQEAVKKLYERTGRLSLRERLQVLLKEDPERVGLIQEKHAGTIDYERPGKKQSYEHLVARYEANLAKEQAQPGFLAFRQEHLEKQWREVLEKKAELVGPIDGLTAEFQNGAYKLLTTEQALRGPVPEPETEVRKINRITMWSLTILGAALMAGFLSRISALGAAGLLLLFYLPMPPWPGVPEAPGPEHSLIINKNLIEFIACLALAALPTGRWIGLDALIRRFVFFRKTD